jgi:hypothetical protein
MKKICLSLAATFVLSTFGALSASADDLDALAGKWVSERKDDQGRVFKQTLEIKKNKFKFRLSREGDDRTLYAEGDVKAETLGPFKTAKFYNIQGGLSASDLQPVDDDRTVIYLLGYNELTTAVNFDKERQEPPMVTKYTKDTKAAAEEAKSLVIDKIVLHKTPQAADFYICLDVTVGDASKRFNIPDKTYSGTEIAIPTELAIPNVRADQTCKFVMKLDDVAGDECTDEMDNKSDGSFKVTASGSQDFKPEDGWTYTIHWHLK